MLFGAHDKHLARIEQLLGVSLASRGNHVVIAGATESVDTACTALRNLYKQLQNGEAVNDSVVDAAVRMARGGESATGGSHIQIHRKRISPRSQAQSQYIRAMQDHDLVFGIGPAGTGKTYLAVCAAVEMFSAGKVDRIILSRPAVEAGERLGFLPGDMQEKIDPYLRPLFDALHDMLPGDQVVRRIASGEFEVAPLAFMRGRTLANAFIILDEAQNTTTTQMKMFLTRLGENSRMVVTGDLSQVDLPSGMRPGLRDAVETLDGVSGVRFVRFTDADVVRPPLVARIIKAYEASEAKPKDTS
ncbi:MAG: AAA family ATPase [Alphaproteobacteria bacterium]|nr:AAA family ATPase [Alphaproteobacteria bacterium]